MTLKECTKDELIFIIERLTRFDKYHLKTVLHELEYKRVKVKFSEAERWGKIADNCRQQYIEILKKHEGKKLIDIPVQEIKAADQCLKEAQKADEKHNKLIKEVDAYGKNR